MPNIVLLRCDVAYISSAVDIFDGAHSLGACKAGQNHKPAAVHQKQAGCLEAQQLARHNAVKEAQTLKHLAKLERIVSKATFAPALQGASESAPAKLCCSEPTGALKDVCHISIHWKPTQSCLTRSNRTSSPHCKSWTVSSQMFSGVQISALAQANLNNTQISRAQMSCCQCSVLALALSTKCIPPTELRAVSCCLPHTVDSACFASFQLHAAMAGESWRSKETACSHPATALGCSRGAG